MRMREERNNKMKEPRERFNMREREQRQDSEQKATLTSNDYSPNKWTNNQIYLHENSYL